MLHAHRRHLRRAAGIALLLLIISFFAKVPGGIKWALIVFGVTVCSRAGLSPGTGSPGWAGCTALNALILFGVAVTAAMRVRRAVRTAGLEPAPVPLRLTSLTPGE